MSKREMLGFGFVAVAFALVNCGGHVDHAGDTGVNETGGSGGSGGSTGDGVGGLGAGATGGSTGGSGGSGSGGVDGGGTSGGSTGGTGMGGSAGIGGWGTIDGGSGNSFIDLLPGLSGSPICRTCISQKCAEAVAPCSYTPSCVAGTACTFNSCNGFSDSACALQCFNDDAKQVSVAETAMQSVYRICTSECIDPVLVERHPLRDMQAEESMRRHTAPLPSP